MQGDLFAASKIRAKYDEVFHQNYTLLNEKQKQAVDNIEGPILVNAGPGTGKTQILATRIGNILRSQDIAPHNILCLTYTDAATVAMRNRLVKIIGPVAHQIHIYTFHGFCNQVIQENLDVFGDYRQLDAITDLESVDIFRSLIDKLDDNNALKRFKYDKYFEASRMKNLYALMKKENLSAESMLKNLDSFLAEKKDSDEFIAKRKTTVKSIDHTFLKGDFRFDKYEIFTKKYDELKAAILEFNNFNKLMVENDRYDFNDMILWVNEAFSDNQDLLLQYQERYQYFLVDEYQDTNGAQNAILNHLIDYWDSPNVFVVGDDDQAIYKFQGANLRNIIDFQKKYNPLTIVLEKNYRSSQNILNVAKQLIELNQERLVNEDEGLTKELIADGQFKENPKNVEIFHFEKISEEYAFIASELEKLFTSDPELFSETAVIFRKHKQINDLVNVLDKKAVPYNIKKRINVLELPLVKNLLNILNYINEEYNRYGFAKGRLFEILHYSYFGIDSIDIGKISLYCQKELEPGVWPEWREVINDEVVLNQLNLKDSSKVLETSRLLNKWINEIPEVTIQFLFENILNEGGILRYVMTQENKSWMLQVVNTLFEFIKNETAKNPDMELVDLLSMFDKMNENKIQLGINKIITSEKGVNFLTAHASKGLEFKRVYIIGCTKNIWDKNSKTYGHYSYPDNINAGSVTNDEDERRLFYVAMTRAETDLIISLATMTEEGKALEPSQYVDEVLATSDLESKTLKPDESVTADFYYNVLLRVDKKIPLIEKDLIDNWLKSFQLSVTHLNKYLNCPISFYFESILRVPTARNAPAGYGTAIHDALNQFLLRVYSHDEKSKSHLLYHFEVSMKRYKSHFTESEFESYMTHGQQTLSKLYDNSIEKWEKVPAVALEEKIAHAEYKGIAIKGFLDKVEIHKDYVHVVDYKTGKYRPAKLKGPNEKDPNGGDYWRQLVFYKMLLQSDRKHNWNMVSGEIDFVEPDRKTGQFNNWSYVVSDEDIEIVGEQIVQTHQDIKDYKFDTTCEDEKCYWCNFVKDNYTLDAELKSDEHSYDEI